MTACATYPTFLCLPAPVQMAVSMSFVRQMRFQVKLRVGAKQLVLPGSWGNLRGGPEFCRHHGNGKQKTGQRQGNANYVLYPLAAQAGADSISNTAARANPNCIFYDVVSGNNSVACSGR